MVKVRKEIIKPGRYAKGDKALVYTEADIDEMLAAGNALREAGYATAWWHEHKPAGDQKAFATKGRNPEWESDPKFAGWSEGFEKGEDGTLYEIADLNEVQAKLYSKTGQFVSPQINPVTVNGRKFSKSIGHTALTTLPVNREQSTTFEVLTGEAGEAGEVVRLSLLDLDETVQMADDAVAAEGEAEKQKFAKLRASLAALGLSIPEDCGSSVSELVGALTSAAETAKLTREQVKATTPNAGPIEEQQPTVAMSELAADVVQFAESGGKTVRQCLLDALKSLGLKVDGDSPIPDDAESLADLLGLLSRKIEMKAYRAKNEGAFQMSDVKTETAVDQATKDEVVQLSAFKAKALERFTADERKAYRSRIESLVKTGRCAPKTAEGLNALADTHQFSEGSDGNAVLDAKLAVLEDLPEGAVWSDAQKVQQFGVSEESRPAFLNESEMTDEDCDKLYTAIHG